MACRRHPYYKGRKPPLTVCKRCLKFYHDSERKKELRATLQRLRAKLYGSDID